MQFKETGSAIEFDPAPAAMHVARCIRIIDLGTALDSMYQKSKHDVFFMWEIPNEMKTYTKDDQEITEPFTIGKYYTMSLSDGAHLRTDLESWRSKPFSADELQGFDPANILGKPCMINVVHKPQKPPKTGVNAIVVSVTPLVKGLECPPIVHKPIYFSLENFDQVIFDQISSGLKSRIMRSDEYIAIHQRPTAPIQNYSQVDNHHPDKGHGHAPVDDGFDDIPF